MNTCPECGNATIETRQGNTLSLTCPNCGWGVATSCFDPWETDNTMYKLFLSRFSAEADKDLIVKVAKITHSNTVTAKKALSGERIAVFEGKASEIKPMTEELRLLSIATETEPKWPF